MATGYRPGLWLAPFTVSANSLLARDHPDWLVRGENGKPAFAGHNWSADLHALDTTHPGARDWLRATFTTIVREWGYDYLKLDFLACGALEGQRHDPRATRASALRDGLALIREIVGDDSLHPRLRLPAAQRRRHRGRHAHRTRQRAVLGAALRGRPGPIQRGPRPADDGGRRPQHAPARLDAPHALDQRSRLPAGPRAPLRANPRRGAFLRHRRWPHRRHGRRLGSPARSPRRPPGDTAQLLPPLAARALPGDYFAYGIPQRASVTLEGATGTVHLVGLFNGTTRDREASLTWSELGLPRGAYHATEFWSGTYLGASPSGVTLHVPPHGAALLALRPVTDEPTLLSTSFHISQGAHDVTAWRYDPIARELRWRSSLDHTASGAFTLWLPQGRSPLRVTSTGASARWRRNPSGEVVVTAEVRNEAEFVLTLDGEPYC